MPSFSESACLLLLAFGAISAQQTNESVINSCSLKVSCGACIAMADCGWCTAPDPEYSNKPRCLKVSLGGCPEEYIWSPDTVRQIIAAKELSKASKSKSSSSEAYSDYDEEYVADQGSDNAEAVFVGVSPQKLEIQIRLNQKHRFEISFVQGETPQNAPKIEVKDNSSSPVSITYYSSCAGLGELNSTNECTDLKSGGVYNFTAEIIASSCPAEPAAWFQTIEIIRSGSNDGLVIALELICSCPCEHPGHATYEHESSKCSHHGTHKCGACECDAFSFGSHCECLMHDVYSMSGQYSCRPDNLTQVDCNARGQCICGVCECEKRQNPEEYISGAYCECDNFSCDREQGKVCGGLERGNCECGMCVCKPGFTGSACETGVSA